MTLDETLSKAVEQIQEIFQKEDYQHEQLDNSLKTLRDQFSNIRYETSSLSIADQQKFILDLQEIEFSLLRQWLINFTSKLPPSVVSSLWDTMRLQIIANIQINPSVGDFYFKISLSCLTSESMISYLMEEKSSAVKNINIDEQLLRMCCGVGAFALFHKARNSPSISISRKIVPTFFEMTDCTERFLRGLIKYLNGCLLDDHPKLETELFILKWLLNMTDIYGFVPYFVKTGYPEAILEWMKVKSDRQKAIPSEVWSFIIDILYNLARHWTGVKALNKLKTLAVVQEWKKEYFSNLSSEEILKNFEEILVAYYLLYILLLEPKEMKRENIANIQTVLDHILERIVSTLNISTLHCGIYHVSEYLVGLAKLVVNDTVLRSIISKDNLFDLFLRKFLEFNDVCAKGVGTDSYEMNALICSSFYTIFWSISFQPDFCVKLKASDEFIRFVEQMSKNESKDEHIMAMKRAAKGILFNLDLVETDFQPLESVEQRDANGGDFVKVMVSYAHKDTKLCQKLVNYLQGRVQGDIWVDFLKLKPPYEDDWEEIARAITHADVVLMLVTENYCTSKSCRREVIHTDKRNKRVVPIYYGKEYQPEDWFEIRVGSATWVRFDDKKTDDEVVENLLSLIHATEKQNSNPERQKSHNTPNLNNQQQTIQSIVINPIAPPSAVTPVLRVVSRANAKTTIPERIVSSTPVLPLTTTTVVPPTNNTSEITMKPIEQWSQVDIQELCKLYPAALQLNSGRAALTYISLLNTDEALLNEYETQMLQRGLSREEFSNIIASLLNIRSTQNVKESSVYPPDQWKYEEIKCWFQQNRLPDCLFDTLHIIDGPELLTYAKLITTSSTRIDGEFDRLKSRISSRYNRDDLFYLDDYARFVNALKQLLIRAKSSSPIYNAQNFGQCRIS